MAPSNEVYPSVVVESTNYMPVLERIAIALEKMANHQDVMSRLQAQILVQGEMLLELNKRGITTQERTAAIYEMVTLTKLDDADFDANRRSKE